MFFVGIDLAERHSAAVCVSSDGTALWETTADFGAQETPPNPFKNLQNADDWISGILTRSPLPKYGETVYAIETPYHHARNAGPALIVQGGVLMRLVQNSLVSHLLVSNVWQGHYGYRKKEHGDSKKWAAALANDFGYVPAMTYPEGAKTLAKQRVDLIDAYLIACWLRDVCLHP